MAFGICDALQAHGCDKKDLKITWANSWFKPNFGVMFHNQPVVEVEIKHEDISCAVWVFKDIEPTDKLEMLIVNSSKNLYEVMAYEVVAKVRSAGKPPKL